MKLIAIDTSGLVASVAVLEDDILRAQYTVEFKKTHSQTLLPMLDEISRMIALDKESVDAIAVAAGPGSFTGLRIGSATAKGLGLALDRPIVEVPTLMGLAFNVFDAKGLICPIMDARRSQVYNGLYRYENHALVTVTDQRPVAVRDLAEEINALDSSLIKDGVLFLGDGVPVYKAELDRLLTVPHTYAPPHLSKQNAASVGALAQILYREGKAIPADEHAPVYLRKSQAEREREEREHADT
jgi:tRNA threonylcarbamoyladenosine biosynthesis protein TsaB